MRRCRNYAGRGNPHKLRRIEPQPDLQSPEDAVMIDEPEQIVPDELQSFMTQFRGSMIGARACAFQFPQATLLLTLDSGKWCHLWRVQKEFAKYVSGLRCGAGQR